MFNPSARHSLIVAIAAAALAGCASTPPELQTGAQCIEHRHGTATVTSAGVVANEGRCTEWRIGPTKRESMLFDSRKAPGASVQ